MCVGSTQHYNIQDEVSQEPDMLVFVHVWSKGVFIVLFQVIVLHLSLANIYISGYTAMKLLVHLQHSGFDLTPLVKIFIYYDRMIKYT